MRYVNFVADDAVFDFRDIRGSFHYHSNKRFYILTKRGRVKSYSYEEYIAHLKSLFKLINYGKI